MAGYHRVYVEFWDDTRQWGERLQRIALYLLTCKHRSTEGLYHLPKGYASEDLGLSLTAVSKAFTDLQRRGFIEYDEEAKVVLLVKALARQRPTTDKQIVGAVAVLARLPKTPLRARLHEVARVHAPELAERMETPIHSNGNAEA